MASNAIQYIINIVGNAANQIGNISRATDAANIRVDNFRNSLARLRDSGMAFEALSTQADKMGSMFGSIFSAGMETELQKQDMTTLLKGDQEAAEALFGKIAEYGKATVYDKAGLIDAQKTMMSFGITGEKAFSTLQQIGDVAMGDKNKMNSLALAFSQATSAGKLQGQDLMQLINAGFNPLQVISEKTGKSMTELKDEMAKGQISSDMLAQSFQWATEEGGLFYQGAEKAGSTVAGRINQIKDSVSEMAVELFDTLHPAITAVLNIAGKAMEFVSKHKTAVLVLVGILGGLAVVIKTMSIVVGAYTTITATITAATAAWTAIQTVFNLVMAMNPVALIIIAIVALIAVIALVCSKITGWSSLWSGVVGFMKYTFMAFVDGVKLYYSTMINGIMIGLDKIKLGWYSFKEACGIGDSDENKAAISQINADVEARQKAIVDGAKKVVDNVKKAKESLSGIKMGWDSDSTMESTTSNLKKKMGLGSQDTLTNGGSSTSSKAANKSTSAITTGGTRNTQITINLGKMIENIVFNGGIEENRDNMTRQVEEAMYRVLLSAQSAG